MKTNKEEMEIVLEQMSKEAQFLRDHITACHRENDLLVAKVTRLQGLARFMMDNPDSRVLFDEDVDGPIINGVWGNTQPELFTDREYNQPAEGSM